jgi:hypothetical protein
MIHRSVERFDGRVDGRLDTDEDAHSQGDPYHGKKGSSFVVTKMAEGDVFEEMKENHEQNPNVKGMSNDPMPKSFRIFGL